MSPLLAVTQQKTYRVFRVVWVKTRIELTSPKKKNSGFSKHQHIPIRNICLLWVFPYSTKLWGKEQIKTSHPNFQTFSQLTVLRPHHQPPHNYNHTKVSTSWILQKKPSLQGTNISRWGKPGYVDSGNLLWKLETSCAQPCLLLYKETQNIVLHFAFLSLKKKFFLRKSSLFVPLTFNSDSQNLPLSFKAKILPSTSSGYM